MDGEVNEKDGSMVWWRMDVWIDVTATTKKEEAERLHILTWDDFPHLPQTITPSLCVPVAPQ